MIRLTVSLLSVALLALTCGSGDSTSGGDTQPVSAQADQAAAPPAPGGAPAAKSAELDPQALSCLDLVAKGRFQQAIDPCMAAVKANPANTELESALDQAQSATKSMAQDAAADAANSQLDDATKNAADKLRY